MKNARRFTLALLIIAMAAPAFAELQNVTVGGSIRLRYNYYSPEAVGRSFTDKGNSLEFFEQRTRLNVKADFSNDVSALIELDSYDIYGEDFRSAAFLFGADSRARSVGDVEVYQAYIDVSDMWGGPVSFRFGRQEIQLGSEWLVGNNDTTAQFRGLSFDGVTARYEHDRFTLTGRVSKVAERSPVEEDGDADLWSVYFSYSGLEDVTIDAYWIFVDEGLAPTVEGLAGFFQSLGNVLGLGRSSDTTTLHTLGLRGAGERAKVDFEVETAFQFGDTSLLGKEADFDAWGANLEVGYTFDVKTQPRIYLGTAFFEGGDNGRGDRDLGFNRLFSDWEYSEFLDDTDLSNVLIYRGGIGFAPSDNVDISVQGSYFEADEDNGHRFRNSDDDLGIEVATYLTYRYSEDLTFEFGYAHFFVGDGIEDGNRVAGNGLIRVGGYRFPGLFTAPQRADDDADYVYFESSIAF